MAESSKKGRKASIAFLIKIQQETQVLKNFVSSKIELSQLDCFLAETANVNINVLFVGSPSYLCHFPF